MASVTICSDLGAPKNKVWHCFHCFPIYFPWSDGTGSHDLRFLNVELKPTFSLSTFTFIKRLFNSEKLGKIKAEREDQKLLQENKSKINLSWTRMQRWWWQRVVKFYLQDISSVQLSHSVMFNSLQPHGLKHARLPCPLPTHRGHLNSCPWSWWRHPTISSSVIPFSSCHQSFLGWKVFSNESVFRIRWTRYWSFSFNISSSSEHPGLISFRMDWLDHLAV